MHLYIHIPFCKQKCHYCDFHFSTNMQAKAAMLDAICTEIQLQRHYLPSKTLETIYFGGGTPSLLNFEDFQKIFETIHQHYSLLPNAEITIEANPDDLDKAKMRDFKNLGINRLSIGIQSFDDKHLNFLNRVHSSLEAENAVKMAQDFGIPNISIDLIYGIPAVDHSVWHKDLMRAVALGVPHISAYCLTIEPKTTFGKWLLVNKLSPIDDEFAATQFEMLLETLESRNYEQYEISNFCLPKQYAVHNSSYWKGEAYLGIGPSAHSYNLTSRQYNIANNTTYIKRIKEGVLPCEIEVLSNFDKANDYLLTSLRTQWGCDLDLLQGLIEQTLDTKQITYYIAKGWLSCDNKVLKLTKAGKLFADKIAADLFLG